jgi:CheY-like chemotaxis protein
MVSPDTLNDLRILAVDDDKTNRRILHGMLTRWGAQTTRAPKGQARPCRCWTLRATPADPISWF